MCCDSLNPLHIKEPNDLALEPHIKKLLILVYETILFCLSLNAINLVLNYLCTHIY